MTISGHHLVEGLEGATCLSDFYNKHPEYKDQDSFYDGLQSRNQKIYYIVCDITKVQVDAIVCPTQTDLRLIPYGLCTKVWDVGGAVLKQACLHKRTLKVGSSFITNGYNLPAKNVIFTAGPTPDAPYNNNERLEILRKNYLSSLHIVRTNDAIQTVAFPCLGTGGGGLDITDANRVAATAIRDWLDDEMNRSSVDAILLCMFSGDQWSDYYEELLKAFPYGLDLQGNNLEDLKDVPKKHLELPTCSASTNILCFKYEQAACKTLKNHFHRMVEMCVKKLDKVVTLKRRFRNCAILLPKRTHDHQVIIFHSEATNMIEVQVTKFNDHIDTIRPEICDSLRKSIQDYFVENLENLTSFEEYLRCDRSSFGQANGLWKYQEVVTLSGRSQICDKHEHSRDFHTILSKDMLLYWKVLTLNIEPCGPSPVFVREPIENSTSSSGSETKAETSTAKENLFVSTNRSVEENEDSCTVSPCVSESPSSLSQQSADWSLPSSPDSLTRVKTCADNANVSALNEYDDSLRKNVKRKKTSLADKLKRNKKGMAPLPMDCLVVPDDSGNETESQFSSQVSLSPDIHTNTLCQKLAQKDLMKLARHMGLYQKRIGLCLELTEADIQNAMSKGEKDTELQAYYIIKKWISINHDNGKRCDVSSLLKVYQECDVDVYQVKQELGLL